jgi:lipopolysaccharide/colanic/teichoic acid biosynthesis glycosyltransferase
VIVLLMGRPVFFVQDRVGRDGRVFRMVKLRTMRVRPRGECLATAKNDHRITPLGKFLRRSYLDKLPQLWNIVQGDRKLIGPRPEQPDLVERYI